MGRQHPQREKIAKGPTLLSVVCLVLSALIGGGGLVVLADAGLLQPSGCDGFDALSVAQFLVEHLADTGGAWVYAAAAGLAAADCLLTGLVEEFIFRWLLVGKGRKLVPVAHAAAASVVVFALCHVLLWCEQLVGALAGGDTALFQVAAAGGLETSALWSAATSLGLPSLASALGCSGVVPAIACILLKFIQAALFGAGMVALFLRKGHLTPCVIAHSAFDLLYLGPCMVLGLSQQPALTWGYAVVLLVTSLLLVPLAKALPAVLRGCAPERP